MHVKNLPEELLGVVLDCEPTLAGLQSTRPESIML